MEAIVVRIGNSLGFKIHEKIADDFNFEVGTKVKMNFKQNGDIVFEKKSKPRQGWSQAAKEFMESGNEEVFFPDFFTNEDLNWWQWEQK